MKRINSEDVPKAGPYSHAVEAGKLIFLSGQIPPDDVKNAEFEEKVEKTLKNVGKILASAGADFSQVVKVTVYLRDVSKFGRFNEIYRQYFPHEPARSVVEVSALPKDAELMIEVIALKED
ncbi:Rid family detoxifying hydrolase [Geoglobus acetivorans]|uniref:Endoribonuclease L-PSP n=1 Tax=Geoglobus acetivorans TaxID=565033 RepID=A0A0A7GF12_GEOAI|nr:Endoribonuclease L-PSP [Geoglobus acetivorans]